MEWLPLRVIKVPLGQWQSIQRIDSSRSSWNFFFLYQICLSHLQGRIVIHTFRLHTRQYLLGPSRPLFLLQLLIRDEFKSWISFKFSLFSYGVREGRRAGSKRKAACLKRKCVLAFKILIKYYSQ